MKNKLGRSRKEEEENKSFMVVPYHLKNMNVMKKLAKKNKKQLASKRNPTLFNTLRNDKDPLEQQEKSGVYRIPLRDTRENKEKAYIGVTTRTIKRRIEEHKRDVRNAKLTTALAIEAYSSDIEIKWDETKKIKSVPTNTQPTITEAVEIIKRGSKELLVNDKLNWEPSGAWRYVMSKAKLT